ncbi:unnamed protein product, partial [Laminaria digitata]
VTRDKTVPAVVTSARNKLAACADFTDTLPNNPCATRQRFYSSTRRPDIAPSDITTDPGVGPPPWPRAQPEAPAVALVVVASELMSVARTVGPAASRSPRPHFFAGPS